MIPGCNRVQAERHPGEYDVARLQAQSGACKIPLRPLE
jgi:hypothetical protein